MNVLRERFIEKAIKKRLYVPMELHIGLNLLKVTKNYVKL